MKKSKQAVSVILNQDLDGVGFAGSHVVVKPGFARNYLLAGGRAVLATPQLLTERAAEIAKAEAKRQAEHQAREELAEKLAASPLTTTLKTGPKGRVFGSITATEIVKLLNQQHQLSLTAQQLGGLPLKTLGSHAVSVKLGLGVTATVPVEISGQAAAQSDTVESEQPAKK